MSAIDDLLAHNQGAAASAGDPGEAPPSRRVAILTCMDARLDLGLALGIEAGEAHVLRNAGGVVTGDAIRSLALSQRKLGTREVMVIHHTNCGLEGLDEEDFRAELTRDGGVEPPFSIEAFADLEEDVCESVLRVRHSRYLPHREAVRGFVYDVATHRVTEVAVQDQGPS